MIKEFIGECEVINLQSVHGEEELKLRPGIHISPPPADGRCECCGKHMSQLKPFDKTGDPSLDDFDGAYLVRTGRPHAPYDEEAVKAWEEAVDSSDKGEGEPYDLLIAKYGEEKGKELSFRVQISSTAGSSWECKDCIILTTDEYFARLWAWTW